MRSNNKAVATKWSKIYLPYALILFAWTFYRAFFHTSLWLEEIVIKGMIFLLPIVLFPLAAKQQLMALGITTKNFFQSVYLGITVGLVLGIVAQAGNIVRHGQLFLSDFGITSGNLGAFIIFSLITAWWEQLLFTGYFLPKVGQVVKDEISQVILTGLLFSLIHLPMYLLVYRMQPSQIIISAILLLILGMGAAILKLRQSNLIAPIMAHALWGITIYLFR